MLPWGSTIWALLYDNQGRYAEAEPLYKRSLAYREKVAGPDHPDVAEVLNNLGLLYDNKPVTRTPSRFSSARWRLMKGARPEPSACRMRPQQLAAIYDTQGRYADAEPLYKRSLGDL